MAVTYSGSISTSEFSAAHLADCNIPTFSLDWKLTNISPIYKKGPRSMAGNYRPVSLKCLASKLME